MGKEISHIIFAEQASRGLDASYGDPLPTLLQECSSAFHFGSIAADTFFYGVKVPFLEGDVPCCGDKIHGTDGNDTSLPLLHMLETLRKGQREPMFREKLAFVCGFLTHVAFDAAFHPCIYYMSGNYHDERPRERKEAVTRHRLIESWLDLFVLRKSSLSLSEFAFMNAIRGNGRVNRRLLRFFFTSFVRTGHADEALWKYLARGYTVQMLLNSLYPKVFWGKMADAANRALEGRLDTLLALFYPWNYAEIPDEITNFGMYRHPVTGEELPGDFVTLWNQASGKSAEFLQAVRDYLFGTGDLCELRSVIKGYSLSMGLVGVPAAEAGYFARVPIERIWAYGNL